MVENYGFLSLLKFPKVKKEDLNEPQTLEIAQTSYFCVIKPQLWSLLIMKLKPWNKRYWVEEVFNCQTLVQNVNRDILGMGLRD